MAAATPKTVQGDICPDPSAHHNPRNSKLQDQASKAALSVTHPGDKGSDGRRSIDALGPDGKLSSAGAAASLKHAQPHDLPSFPSVGINSQSGTQAATLASQNQKPFEHWKPGLSSSAGRAALVAHRDGGKLDLWQPGNSKAGHTAAGAAMGKQHGLSPQIDYGHTEDGRKKALLAATKSVSSGRRRSGSTPTPVETTTTTTTTAATNTTRSAYPDAENSAYNALNAASVAHRPSGRSNNQQSDESSAAQARSIVQNMPREMYTEHPPVSLDTDEDRRRKAALRASTLSMSKQLSEVAEARAREESQAGYAPPSDLRQQAKNYLNLQEAAQKLAAERLEKLDPDGVLAYREHYGYKAVGRSSSRKKLSARNRPKSEGHDPSEDDAVRAGRIRHQMNRFNEQLADVDKDKEKRRANDRSSLMAAAEKAVHSRMGALDKQVFEETGKVTPAMMEEWEAKARAKAAENSGRRMEKHGLVNVGGGKYMAEGEVEAIAQGRMQPTLDEIAENAQRQRARDEEIRLDQEERKRQAALEKERNRESKAEKKQAAKEEKEQEKVMKRLEKEEARQLKEAKKEKELEARRSKDSAEVNEDNDLGHRITATTEISVTEESGNDHGEVQPKANKPNEGDSGQPETIAEAAASNPVEDPPGVPKAFPAEPSKSSSSSPASPAPEPATTTTKSGQPAPTKLEPGRSTSTPTDRKEKRNSRLKGFFGKFKRSSRHTSSENETEDTTDTTSPPPPATQAKPAHTATEAAEEAKILTPTGDAAHKKGRDSTAAETEKVPAQPESDPDPLSSNPAVPVPGEPEPVAKAKANKLTKPRDKGKARASASVSPSRQRRARHSPSPSPSLSPASSVHEDVRSLSPSREGAGDEEFEEAKDTFEDGGGVEGSGKERGALPIFGRAAARGRDGSRSPARSVGTAGTAGTSGSKFREEV